jgi:chromosome segregation ATPase
MEKLKSHLAESNTTVARLEAQLVELQKQVQDLGADNQRLKAAEAELNQNLSSANGVIQAHEGELKGLRDHIAQLTVANQKMRDQGAADSQKLAQLGRLAIELQDMQRRRTTLQNTVLRRYKELTEQYRSLSGVLDRRAESTAIASGPDLARIQNVIALAEDDLRQLNSLDAEVGQLQKKMVAVR